jgi:hypothetical protein
VTILIKRHEKRQSKNFVPSSPGGYSGARLEGRALVAAAIWRRTPGDPLRDPDNVTAQAGNTPTVNTADSGTVNAAEVDAATGPDGSTLSITASSTSQIVDLDDPAAPAAPIGNFAVSMNATSALGWSGTGTGATPVVNSGAGGNGSRAYVLADDGTGAAGTSYTLTEHFDVTYSSSGTGAILNANAGIDTAGLGIQVTGANQLNNLQIGTTNIALGTTTVSGTVNLNGAFGGGGNPFQQTGSVSYGGTSGGVDLTITRTVGTLPTIARDPTTGFVVGVPFDVAYNAGIGIATAGGQSSGLATMSLHYDASLS